MLSPDSRAILPAVRQKLYLSPCADSRSRLSLRRHVALRISQITVERHAGHVHVLRAGFVTSAVKRGLCGKAETSDAGNVVVLACARTPR